jgi:thiosulfate reductase cytochrome b subunit
MAEAVFHVAPRAAADLRARPRHALLVRITHWLTTIVTAALLISGGAILLAHPRLYWGETGAVGGPSLIDLPLPFVLTGQSGWGRSLHFLAAWVGVGTGALYILHGVISGHLRRELLPSREQRSRSAMSQAIASHFRVRALTTMPTTHYNVLQRTAYAIVVFALFPLTIWTGLAMSPAVTSVSPMLVDVLGGQQSARTIHFAAATAIASFIVVHVVMVALSGFSMRMRAMTIGSGGRVR